MTTTFLTGVLTIIVSRQLTPGSGVSTESHYSGSASSDSPEASGNDTLSSNSTGSQSDSQAHVDNLLVLCNGSSSVLIEQFQECSDGYRIIGNYMIDNYPLTRDFPIPFDCELIVKPWFDHEINLEDISVYLPGVMGNCTTSYAEIFSREQNETYCGMIYLILEGQYPMEPGETFTVRIHVEDLLNGSETYVGITYSYVWRETNATETSMPMTTSVDMTTDIDITSVRDFTSDEPGVATSNLIIDVTSIVSSSSTTNATITTNTTPATANITTATVNITTATANITTATANITTATAKTTIASNTAIAPTTTNAATTPTASTTTPITTAAITTATTTSTTTQATSTTTTALSTEQVTSTKTPVQVTLLRDRPHVTQRDRTDPAKYSNVHNVLDLCSEKRGVSQSESRNSMELLGTFISGTNIRRNFPRPFDCNITVQPLFVYETKIGYLWYNITSVDGKCSTAYLEIITTSLYLKFCGAGEFHDLAEGSGPGEALRLKIYSEVVEGVGEHDTVRQFAMGYTWNQTRPLQSTTINRKADMLNTAVAATTAVATTTSTTAATTVGNQPKEIVIKAQGVRVVAGGTTLWILVGAVTGRLIMVLS